MNNMDNIKKKRGIFLTTMLVVAGFSAVINIINFFHPLAPPGVYVKQFFYLDLFNFLTVVFGSSVGVIGAFFWKKWAALLVILSPLCWQVAETIYLPPIFSPPSNFLLTAIFDGLLIWSFVRKWKLFK